MLERFFAVTESASLYEVSGEISENGWPTVKRIAGPHNSHMPIGSCLRNGELVGIGSLGVCLFNPGSKYGRNFERMNTRAWGGSTSRIVGLFLERSAAEACMASNDHAPLSPRYREQTRATLKAIGSDHPSFEIGGSFGQFSDL